MKIIYIPYEIALSLSKWMLLNDIGPCDIIIEHVNRVPDHDKRFKDRDVWKLHSDPDGSKRYFNAITKKIYVIIRER